MIHLAISCSSYLLFFVVKALTPVKQASWRALPAHRQIVHLPR